MRNDGRLKIGIEIRLKRNVGAVIKGDKKTSSRNGRNLRRKNSETQLKYITDFLAEREIKK